MKRGLPAAAAYDLLRNTACRSSANSLPQGRSKRSDDRARDINYVGNWFHDVAGIRFRGNSSHPELPCVSGRGRHSTLTAQWRSSRSPRQAGVAVCGSIAMSF